jgi:hypothetical protein
MGLDRKTIRRILNGEQGQSLTGRTLFRQEPKLPTRAQTQIVGELCGGKGGGRATGTVSQLSEKPLHRPGIN